MEKTLILFIEQFDDNNSLKYKGCVSKISTNNKITPDSKLLSNIKIDDCVLVYNVCGANKNQRLISFNRLEIIDKAVSTYYEKGFSEGLILQEFILQESYFNMNNANKQWLIEPNLKT